MFYSEDAKERLKEKNKKTRFWQKKTTSNNFWIFDFQDISEKLEALTEYKTIDATAIKRYESP